MPFQNDDELIAANTEGVAMGKSGADDGGGAADKLVAGLMPVLVIDLLQEIDIKENHSIGNLLAFIALHKLFHGAPISGVVL